MKIFSKLILEVWKNKKKIDLTILEHVCQMVHNISNNRTSRINNYYINEIKDGRNEYTTNTAKNTATKTESIFNNNTINGYFTRTGSISNYKLFRKYNKCLCFC